MEIREVMTTHVECIRPEASLLDAARKMKKFDIGPLPVCGDNDRLVGMVTDRDIVVRAIADGRDLEETKVQDIMTPEVHYCMENHDVEHVARLMRDRQVRRLVVLNDDRRLVGIVSLGDLAVETGDEEMTGEALEGISQPAGSV
jgi:CBS domain-containing protein